MHEAKILDILKGGVGIPSVYWKGPFETQYQALALELLGPSLEDLFNMCERKLSLHEVRTLACGSTPPPPSRCVGTSLSPARSSRACRRHSRLGGPGA